MKNTKCSLNINSVPFQIWQMSQLCFEKKLFSFSFKKKDVFVLYIFFIIQRVKARAIPCPHQPPTKGDNTVSVAQGGTATPDATKQLLSPDRVLRELYIYIRQIN